MNRKRDLRVIKTRRAIEDAFVDLLLEKGFANITVQDIADRALINRKTFYGHYQDKYELAGYLVEKALQIASDPVLGATVTSREEAEACCEQLYANRRLILAVWDIHEGEGLDFTAALKSDLEEKYLAMAEERDTPGDHEFQAALFSAFVTETLRHVLEAEDVDAARQNPFFATGELANLQRTLESLNTWDDGQNERTQTRRD